VANARDPDPADSPAGQPAAPPAAAVLPEQATSEELSAAALARRWSLALPHRPELLRIARRRVDSREDAEDVVATALLRAVTYPRLDESRIGAFLCTTVMRLAVDVHRDRARQLAVGRREVTRTAPQAPLEETICDQLEAVWLSQQLQDCPARERDVLDARLRGMSAQETSLRLGLTAKATENAFTRVRQRGQRLVAATLAGLGVLAGLGRRAPRTAVATAPVAAVAAAALLFSQQGVSTPSAPATTPRTVVTTDKQTAVRGAADHLGPSPAAAARDDARTPPTTIGAPTGQQTPKPNPGRTELRAPVLVDPEVLEMGPVWVEDRHADESFEQSVQRCVNGATTGLPKGQVTGPCR
jgi:RNA polymerase sigma factor (sigma-70 family)